MKSTKKILGFMCLFLLTSCMATPEIRLMAGGVQMRLVQEAPVSITGNLSPDGNYLLAGGWKYGGFALWDISRGALIRKFATEPITVLGMSRGIHVAFTPDGKYAWSSGKVLKLWELSSGREIRTMGDQGTDRLALSSDGLKVLVSLEESGLGKYYTVLYDVISGQIINKRSGRYYNLVLSADGKYALGAGTYGSMDFWMASTGETIKRFKATHGHLLGKMVQSVAFSADNAKALSGGTDGTIRLWDLFSGAELLKIKGHTGIQGVMSVDFSPDGKYILSGGGSDGLLKLWDIKTGREIRSLRVFSTDLIPAPVMYASFSHEGKRIISIAADASIRVWDTTTGEEIALMVGFMDGEWLAITSDGYYNASEKGAQYLNTKFEGKDYTVDQFYDVFYRPDIVAAKLRGEDIKDLITITMQDAVKSPPPIVEIVHLKDTDSPKIKVCYSVKSSGGGIGEVRLFHNGKLIQSDGYYREVAKSATAEKMQLASLNSRAIYDDVRSLTIKARTDSNLTTTKPKGNLYEDCKEIDAIPGENEVSVSAFNSSNTVQSYMKTINFNSRVTPEDPHLYILSIGIDQYRESSVNLRYAVKDAKDLENKLKTQSATLYKPQNIHYTLLTDKEATKTNITNKIDELSRVIKPQDGFILFVAGHGVLLQNQYYMLTHDFNGQVRDTNMISSNEIVEMSKKIKSLSQLFIFDTCHAGGVDTIVSGLYDARMSVLAKKMGLHIYASASDKQAAMDGYKGNGLFTYTLLDGLNNNRGADRNKDGKVSVVGLGGYSKERTTSISKEIGHSQTPLIINFGKDYPIYELR